MKKKGSTAALPAKLSRPRLASSVVLRRRLFSTLDEALKTKAVWVSGPPGTGKTTLVNSYVESKKLKTLWYQVDGADSDPATFFHYLGVWMEGASLKNAPMPKFSPDAASNLVIFSSRYFQELFSRVKPPFLIVLDNFQEVSGDPKFLESVCAGMNASPGGCSIIMISRTDPPPAYARACVNNEMAVLSWDEMRLTESETADVARLLGYSPLSRAAIKDLHLKAEGWMAGLLLLLERAKTGARPGKETSGGAIDTSFNYFMSEIFDKIDLVKQEFLLKSSLFQIMTPEMACEVSGEKEAARILSSLSSGNFFVSMRLQPGISYQYHPLFRDFLLARAKEVFGPLHFKSLMSRAAKISEKAGHIDEAAGLFIEAGDWPGLRGFVYSHADSLISQGRLKLLEGMLKAVPQDLVTESPWLLYYYGVCLLPSSPSKAGQMFAAAYDLFTKEGDQKGLFLSWAGAVDTILYEWKDFKPLDRWIGEFEMLMKKFRKFPSEEVEVRVISCIFSALMFRQPGHPELPKWEERINRLVKGSKDDALKISITRNLILYYLWTGNIAKAGVLVGLLKPAAEKIINDPLAQLMWLRSAALYKIYISSFETAFEFVEEGLRLAEKTGIHLLDSLFYGVGIYCFTFTDDVARAEHFLDMIRNALNYERCMDLIFYHHMTSIVERMKGRLPESIEHANLTLDLALESGMVINGGVYQFAVASMLIEAGRLEGIEKRIAGLKYTGALVGSHFHNYLGFYAEALLDLKRGNHRKSMESFAKALKICKEHGIKVLVVLNHPFSVASLCAKALEEGIETEFVKELIQLNNLKRYPPRKGVEDWPWEIKIYSFGRFEIYREGKKIEFSRKAQQKPLALLKELISLGARHVPDEAITDSLWPDSEGDLASASFATTLHRLRKLLGNDKAIRNMDGMVSLDESCFWVDAWAFSDLIEKAEPAADKFEAAGLLDRAARFYTGEYLPGEVLSSAVSFRERLKSKFIRCVDKLGKLHEEAGDLEKALECYRRGLEADELSEGFYRRMMHCHNKAGNRAEAIKTYTRLKTILANTFGINPSSETEALCQSIFKR